ncbi:DEAD/DEAH box helicase [Natronomonas salina]|uniref:DEAD/DEAH box helicase n=1 Tax=Natronomonas salina TaxID=1710540 RepID=UPI0015B4954B|nr:DEAD/DEAH box helicase [Natronomonas salina]QLD89704.1 DEAD/DEAH box helicase [Natronomonas salina]
MATATDEPEYIEGPMLVDGLLEKRRYQLRLAETAQRDHTLVCLPTGLGKTAVSLLVTAERLSEHGGTSLLLAPTKPLVQQHATFYREALTVDDDEVVVFTGDVRPDDRAELWDSASVVCATPQVVENDLVGNRVSLADVTHVTFDECHRATGDYAYNYIAERYHEDAQEPLVTGMSASPGGDKEEILTVCDNLGLREVAVMTEDDADVAEHTFQTDVEWERVELPETVIEIRDALNEVVSERLEKLKQLGVTNSTDPNMSQKQLNAIRAKLQELINNDNGDGYKGMSAHAEIMKLRRAVELVETQSVESLRRYFERQREDARSSGSSKASQRFVSEPRVKEAMRRAEEFDDLHPKFRRTRILLAQTLGIEDGERVIVFTESRDTAETLTEFLGEHFETRRFVGQGDKEGSDGMTQTEQKETLDEFRAGEFEVLVSTSVAEEGLDVPDVDLVLFYEPVPKGIRSIQRKGRTGRASEGRVVVLLAEDTRDEAFFWMSRNEEKKMEKELRKLKNMEGEIEVEIAEQRGLDEFESEGDRREPSEQASGEAASPDDESSGADGDTAEAATATEDADASDADGQAGLADFAGDVADEGESTEDDADTGDGDENEDEGDDPEATVATAAPDGETVEVVVDQRELDSHIARDLSTRDGIETRLETLEVGDYVLSDRVVVERKSVADFVDTLVGGDRSMFEQVGAAARYYARPVVIIEGEDLYGERNVHPNAIRGALASLAVDFGASVMQTADADETADLLEVVATREQETASRDVSVHGEKGGKTLTEQQEYVVGAIAEVGPVTARGLLEHFGSVEAVMTAEEEDLLEVDGVGEVTAGRIREVTGTEYAGTDRRDD